MPAKVDIYICLIAYVCYHQCALVMSISNLYKKLYGLDNFMKELFEDFFFWEEVLVESFYCGQGSEHKEYKKQACTKTKRQNKELEIPFCVFNAGFVYLIRFEVAVKNFICCVELLIPSTKVVGIEKNFISILMEIIMENDSTSRNSCLDIYITYVNVVGIETNKMYEEANENNFNDEIRHKTNISKETTII